MMTSKKMCLSRTTVSFILALISFSVAAPLSQGQTFQVLHYFTGSPSDGAGPANDLLLDKAGNIYGTAGGGTYDLGVVFKLDSAGKESVLYNFSKRRDGQYPTGRLIMDSAGNLYGTTQTGGISGGYGTVFRLTTTGKRTLVHSFGNTPDGAFPIGLAMDSAGNLFGVTNAGGDLSCNPPYGCGTVFKVHVRDSKTTALYTFTSSEPVFSRLILDPAGNLYGTAEEGGEYGEGVLFKVDTSGNETVLYNFTGGTDGRLPSAALIRGPGGDLYGTAEYGGAFGVGTVFKLTEAGEETVLYSFGGVTSDGAKPIADLVRDKAGNLYGTTWVGGTGDGTVFELSKNGEERVLHSFSFGDGAFPYAGLAEDSQGNLYGTAAGGGDNDQGVVFKITP
jgi:uncharacterized repeat protein (TIGR03803 family)